MPLQDHDPTLDVPLASDDARRWEDEIVYVVIIEKFFDGDPTNNIMRDRFFKERERYESGFWGGDLTGVIAKLDDMADLGVTTLLLYPVMQNDESPAGKFLPTGYRPKEYEHVDKNFGDNATLRASSTRPTLARCVSFSICLWRCPDSSTRSWSIPRRAIGSPLRPSTSADAMYVFLRTLGDDRILVVLNGSDRPRTFAIPIGGRAWRLYQLDDLIGGGLAKPAGSDAAIDVEAFGARIVRVR